jgi:hypothetical protein
MNKTDEITQAEYDKLESLDKKHDDMWKRLDGTYQIHSNILKNEEKFNNEKINRR